MLKIGEFARLAQVSIKTLRHYDKIDLLVPAHVDESSGYRLYKIDQLTDIMQILALKDCGFTLEEIADIRATNTHDTDTIVTLLSEQIVNQQEVVDAEQARLQRLVARRQQMTTMSNAPQYDFVIKQTEALTLVGQRTHLPEQSDIDKFVRDVLAQLTHQLIVPIGPMVHVYFAVDENGYDLFVGAPVMALPSELDVLTCQRLQAGQTVASVLHHGDYATIQQTGAALADWIVQSGYQYAGHVREIYHRSPAHTSNPEAYLTELQCPISQISNKHDKHHKETK
ncbi:MAG: MerR family transcriptional regulator [Chloroflexota bacterium]